jgi:transposase InsO family protein
VIIKVEEKTIYKADRINGKLWIKSDGVMAKTEQKGGFQEIHERYGHISLKILISLPEVVGRKIPDSLYCEACEQRKSHKPAAKNYGGIHTTGILEWLHTDLIGPIKPESRGNRYLLVITDDYSRYIIAISIRQKSDAAENLINVINVLERITKKQTKQIQADFGGEFRGTEFITELRQRGIIMKETIPYHSETNPIAEQVKRTIMTIARTAIIAKKLPKIT